MGKFTALLFWLVALFAREHPGCSRCIVFPSVLSQGFLGAISSILIVAQCLGMAKVLHSHLQFYSQTY